MEGNKRKVTTADRYLCFKLGNEDFCIEILKIKEIVVMREIAPIPKTPDFIRGVLNLRGQIIPIIDLRLKFGMPFKEYSETTGIIIVEVLYKDTKTYMGVVVDTIDEVIGIPEEKVSKLPYLNSEIQSDFIRGVADINGAVKILLDIEKVLSNEEFVLIQAISKEEQKN